MTWQKRDCPIEMRIVPYGAGWQDVYLDIGGDSHFFSVSGAMCDGVAALVRNLYALYPNQAYCECDKNQIETFSCEYKSENGVITNFRIKGDREEGICCIVPYRASFYWDMERDEGVRWTITKPKSIDQTFDICIDLEVIRDDETMRHHYEVSYADMCYAVGRALTEAVKHNGFAGFNESVWSDDVNVRHLCFLKACGMGRPEALKPTYGKNRDDAVSSFADELELLGFDM